MKNPYNKSNLVIIEAGSLTDFQEHGGNDQLLFEATKSSISTMKVGEHKRPVFDWDSPEDPEAKFLITLWVLRISEGLTPDDFRFCYSSEGIQEQRILRGWNI